MSDPDDLARAHGDLPLRHLAAALSAVTGDYSRPADACHVDTRPTIPPPPPDPSDDTQPEETDPC